MNKSIKSAEFKRGRFTMTARRDPCLPIMWHVKVTDTKGELPSVTGYCTWQTYLGAVW